MPHRPAPRDGRARAARHARPRGVGRDRHVDRRLRRRHGADRPGRPVGGGRLAGPRHHRLAAAATCSATTSSASAGCGRSPRAGPSAPSGSPSPTPAPTPAASAPGPSAEDGGWLINGRKTFISNAGTDMSFGVTLLARVAGDDEASPPTPPSSSRRTRPGFTMGPKMRGIGWQGLDTRELFFDDVWVPDEHLVGDPEPRPRPVPAARSRSAASRSRRCRSASPRPCSTWRPTTPRSGCSSASPSRSSRPCSSSWPTSPPSSRRPAGSPTAPPTSATPASRS